MKFVLHYRGPLKANAGPAHKQAIRETFHHQLRELWKQRPLRTFTSLLNDRVEPALSSIRHVDGHHFAPLVTAELRMAAELDIVFLRPEEPGCLITQGGDIDNRLKTLFDALRLPKDSSELSGSYADQPGEEPFYCLLEDDNLITSVNVQTERLLDANAGPNDVLLLVRVRTWLIEHIWANMGLD